MPWTAQTVAATARLEGEEFILSMSYLPTSHLSISPSNYPRCPRSSEGFHERFLPLAVGVPTVFAGGRGKGCGFAAAKDASSPAQFFPGE